VSEMRGERNVCNYLGVVSRGEIKKKNNTCETKRVEVRDLFPSNPISHHHDQFDMFVVFRIYINRSCKKTWTDIWSYTFKTRGAPA
jgi:hypothetical protein